MMLTPRCRSPSALQDLEADPHLLDRIGREADADGVADPHPEQAADADRRLHRAGHQPARLGDPEMDRRVGRLGQPLVGRRRQEHVRRLHADLELVEVVVLEDADMIEPALDHRLRARLAVLLQQVPLQRPGVHPDPHRAAVVPRRLDHLAHPLRRADVARIDPQARRPRLGRLDGAAVVEVDVGDDRHRALAHDLPQRPGRGLVRAGHPHDVGAGLGAGLHLRHRRRDVGGQRVGHRLHADRRVAADRHRPDVDAPRLAPVDVAPGADWIVRHGVGDSVQLGLGREHRRRRRGMSPRPAPTIRRSLDRDRGASGVGGAANVCEITSGTSATTAKLLDDRLRRQHHVLGGAGAAAERPVQLVADLT